jgi:branched-chain amino acid transport system ATP-binding protein
MPQSSAIADRPLSQGPAPLLLERVSKRFGGVQAVDSVSLDVPPGAALGIIGPNGAGKSTLLKLIAGLHRPDEGEIRLGDLRLTRSPQHLVARRGVALAHQVPRPFNRLSVRDNVLVAAVAQRHPNRGSPDRRVDDVLDVCGLSQKARQPAQSLGVLDLKRLEVARALAASPTVLMLDEVAAGLVGRELTAAIDLIHRVRTAGCTLLLVEHIERVVREVVEQVVVLDWGRQIAAGTPEAVAQDERVREVYLGASEERASTPRRRATSGPAPRRVLELDGVSAGYAGLLAIRDLSLHVDEGEVVAVLGANGAGKTTLAGAISGALDTRAGRIVALGADVTAWPAHRRARHGIAHCQEGRRVFAPLSVRENLTLGAPPRLSRHERERRLEKVHATFPVLLERAEQPAGTLSGGQQQMLAVARALMAEPRLLICDELSLGLAPVAVDALYEALAQINHDGVTILLVEQNVHRCLALAGRAYVLSRGRITYAGPSDALLDETNLDDAYFGPTKRRRAESARRQARRN